MIISRRLALTITKDLKKKMVLLAGPRQCGKTFFSKGLKPAMGSLAYYNWDISADRKDLLNARLNAAENLWVFDEIHKYRKWRNWLKGVYDQFHEKHSILVTGSAKLDIYNRGGDSLQGRYFFYRMHPFTLSEVMGTAIADPLTFFNEIKVSRKNTQKTLQDLFTLGGFPEPFLSQSETEAERWRNLYGTRLVREEVRDLEKTEDLATMELLFDRLSEYVASPLSINNLREDLEVAHGTVSKWITIFENLYGVFRVLPFGPPKIKAVKKEAKLYFWDWARVSNPGARFENLVAVHLLRYCHWVEDTIGKKAELRFMRAKTKQEVDFVVFINNKAHFLVETKLSEEPIDRGMQYFLERAPVSNAFQIHLNGNKDYETKLSNNTQVRVLPASSFLMALA